MKRFSTEWLSVCGGCHVSLIDLHEDIYKVLDSAEICHSPILTDIKDFPDVDIGILSGAILSKHDLETALKMRKSSKNLIAFGTCAVYGGISGVGYVHTKDEIFDTVYRDNKTTITTTIPDEVISALEDTVVPLDMAVDVDLYLPGCPPHRHFTFSALKSLLEEKAPPVDHQTICGRCHREMIKTEQSSLKRLLDGVPDKSICFLSQGYLCLGSVTLDRCRFPCTNKGMVCTGCSGPSISILQEPDRDIRTELAERMSCLTNINKQDIINEIEKFSKTYYAYVMASKVINEKNTFLIKKWMKRLKED